jgi:hypothetical protein
VADTVIITGEKTITVVTVGVQGPAGVSGSSVPATNTTIGGIIVGDNLSITGNGVLSAQPGGVTAFNNRTGNVTLTANDVTTLVDANYIQVWKDTQTTAGTLSQFPKYSSITSASGPIQGYSRGLLTSNTSGTVTKTIFDGSLYSSSGSTILQYKSMGFNANDTGTANTSKTGRLLLGQYGEVYLESSTKVNANTLITATFDVQATQRPSGTTQLYDPHAINGGIHARYAVGTAGAYNPSSNADRVTGGVVAEIDLYSISRIVSYNNGTYIGRPSQIYLTATNDLTAADPSLAFDHAYDYKTILKLGESAELVFQNANRTLLRTPNMTDYSILTQGYADTRYQAVGAYLTSANLTFANLTGTPTTLVGYGITDGLTSANLTPYLTISNANATYSVLGHTHTISNVTGLQTALDAKLPSANFTYSNLTGKPSTFAPSAHNHAISEVTGLQTALDLKLLSANFTYANITGKPTLANVATSGSYADLSNTPNLTLYLTTANAASSYLPSANFTYANITGKPTFATVATSGSYTDLSNTPAAYSLPTASTTVLGGVRVDGSTITITGGVISAATGSSYTLPTASTTVLGGVKVDGSSIVINSGIISSTYSYTLPAATVSTLGGVRLGTGVSLDANGFLTTDVKLGANSFTGTQNLQDNELIRAKLRDYSESVSSPTISSGTLTLNLETSNIFTVSLNAAITTITISNPPASGSGGSFTLIFTADGTARAVTWPSSIKWAGGAAPTITSASGKVDSFAFFTSDGGTNWQGYVGGQNF